MLNNLLLRVMMHCMMQYVQNKNTIEMLRKKNIIKELKNTQSKDCQLHLEEKKIYKEN